jgi:hypothetical protein
MDRRWPIAFAFAIAACAPAAAAERWTFCVGGAPGGKDVWITEVFPAAIERERIEASYRNFLDRQGAAHAVAQCPLPSDDKIGVVNAQIHAEDFNQKLGATLHSVSAQEFSPRR